MTKRAMRLRTSQDPPGAEKWAYNVNHAVRHTKQRVPAFIRTHNTAAAGPHLGKPSGGAWSQIRSAQRDTIDCGRTERYRASLEHNRLKA